MDQIYLNKKQKALLKEMTCNNRVADVKSLARSVRTSPWEVDRWLSDPRFLHQLYLQSLKLLITRLPGLLYELKRTVEHALGTSQWESGKYISILKFILELKETVSIDSGHTDAMSPIDRMIQLITEEQDRFMSEMNPNNNSRASP